MADEGDESTRSWRGMTRFGTSSSTTACMYCWYFDLPADAVHHPVLIPGATRTRWAVAETLDGSVAFCTDAYVARLAVVECALVGAWSQYGAFMLSQPAAVTSSMLMC